MKTLLSFIFIVASLPAMAKDCQTIDGIQHKCGDIADMIHSINNSMQPLGASVYSFKVETVKNKTDLNVGRYMINYSLDGNTATTSYFQDYILNNTKGRFHLYHFVKNSTGQYDVYGERDQIPTGSLRADLKMASSLEYVGTLESAKIDDTGMLIDTTIFSEFGTYNVLSHNGQDLIFTIQEDNSKGELVLEEIYSFEYRILF